ncbi:MAG: hypothetical protein HZB38_10395, partial [Planctomycetes bacterium]|nr:hypothetical protein [Planctomycetota bacterium]
MIRWQLAAIAALAAGCAPKPLETFSFSGTPLVWPLPPDPPRIRYIGKIVGEASLGRPAGLGEALKAVVQGASPPRAFSTPTAVALAGMQVFVADPSHPAGPCVHALDLAAKQISVIEIADGALLKRPIDLAIHGQTLAVADSQREAVFLFGLDGRFQRTVGAGELNRPAAVAWSSDGALLWVLDSAAHEAVAFTRDGRRSHAIGGRGSTEGLFN